MTDPFNFEFVPSGGGGGGGENTFFGLNETRQASLINAWRCGLNTDLLFDGESTPITGDGDVVNLIKDAALIGLMWADSGNPVYVSSKKAIRFDASNDFFNIVDSTHQAADLGAARLHKQLAFSITIHFELQTLPSAGSMALVTAGNTGSFQSSMLYLKEDTGTHTIEWLNRDGSSDVLALSGSWSPSIATEYTISVTRTSAGLTSLRLDGSEVANGTPSSYSTFGAADYLTIGVDSSNGMDLDGYVRGFAFDSVETDVAFYETWTAETA